MAKQPNLPGMTPKHIAEIEEAAEELRELRTQRMELGESEEKAQAALVEVMKKHKVTAYKIDDEYEAIVEAKERAFVRKIKKHTVPGAKKAKDGEEEAAE